MRRLIPTLAVLATLAAALPAAADVPPDSPYMKGVTIRDATGAQTGIGTDPLIVSRGASTALDITASTLVAAGAHRVATVCVITAGSAAGTVNDAATTGAAAAANEVAAIPNAVGCFAVDFPVTNGLVIVPGTSQAVSVSYN